MKRAVLIVDLEVEEHGDVRELQNALNEFFAERNLALSKVPATLATEEVRREILAKLYPGYPIEE